MATRAYLGLFSPVAIGFISNAGYCISIFFLREEVFTVSAGEPRCGSLLGINVGALPPFCHAIREKIGHAHAVTNLLLQEHHKGGASKSRIDNQARHF